MGVSADVEWFSSEDCGSAYLKFVSKETKEVFHEIHLANSEHPSLSSIIHEINECEINDLLNRLCYHNSEIKITEVMFKIINYKHGHIEVGDKIPVSHLISPYGCCGCCMPRIRHKARW